MKIAFLTNVPAPYRVDFFNELGNLCELTVFFEKGKSDERDESWTKNAFTNFKGIFLRSVKSDVDKAISFDICKHIKRDSYDHVIVANAATPTGIISILYFKLMNIPYWIEGDGGFAKSGKSLKEKLKKFLLKDAIGCFSTSKAHDLYYKTYGVSDDRIFRYPFTALFERDIRTSICDSTEKKTIHQELGIREDRYILAVGQFIHRKGFDLLLEAAIDLPNDIGIYFVGGTPPQEYTELKQARKLDTVHFISFTDKETLKKWYAGAEIMVLPTREDIWGLVVNEAMAQALPVITTDRCIAGQELVENGVNGYIIPANEVDPIAKRINEILADPQLHHTMRVNSLKRIREYTLERMAQRHFEILNGRE